MGRDSDHGGAGTSRGRRIAPRGLLEIDEFALALAALFRGQRPGRSDSCTPSMVSPRSRSASQPPIRSVPRTGTILARQTIHAAARRHGLRVSFAPLISAEGAGERLRTSTRRSGAAEREPARTRPWTGQRTGAGASYLAGLLRDLPAIVGLSAPSVPSLARLRPGYFASAYAFWGDGEPRGGAALRPRRRRLLSDRAARTSSSSRPTRPGIPTWRLAGS